MWSLCPLYEEAEFGCGEKQTSPNGVSTLSSLKVVTPRAMTRGQPPGSGEGVTGICEWQIEGRLCCAYSHSHTVSRELLWHLASLLQPDQCIQALALRSTFLILLSSFPLLPSDTTPQEQEKMIAWEKSEQMCGRLGEKSHQKKKKKKKIFRASFNPQATVWGIVALTSPSPI